MYPRMCILSQHPHLHPSKWYHRVTNVTKNANIAEMAENYMNRMSAHTSPPHNPMESGPEKIFQLKKK